MFALSSAVCAEEPFEFPKPTAEHEWLKKFVGEWESTSEAPGALGQPAVTCQGKSTSRMLGELWVISQIENEMQGLTVHAIQTIGYDPEKKKYIGTWVDSMMNHLWKYEGSVDDQGTKLTLEAEGPNFLTPGKTTKFRDAYEFKSDDHIVATASMLGEDGQWIQFMKGDMRRKK
jgi:hypothetical protein